MTPIVILTDCTPLMQVHKLLQGLPTIRSLVSVGSSAAKLITLPLKNYREDHKLLKGVQRGEK